MDPLQSVVVATETRKVVGANTTVRRILAALARGLYGIGADYVGLGDMHWTAVDPILEAADLIQIEPVSGVAQAQCVVLSPDCAMSHSDCSSAVDYLDPREGPKTNAIHGAHPISPPAPIAGARVP